MREIYTRDGGLPHALHPLLSATSDWTTQDADRILGEDPITGLFGLTGLREAVPLLESEPHRAETIGPNCAAYQKYLLGENYDVKQAPTDQPDWIYK